MQRKWFAITAIIALIIGGLLAESFYYFIRELLPKNIEFVAYNPFDGFMILINLGLAISIILFAVFVLIVLWKEYKNALYRKEREFLKKILLPVIGLYVFGFCFGIFLYTQIMLPFFVETNVGLGLKNLWSLKDIISGCVGLAFILGLCFELPILIKGLLKFNFVTKDRLRELRLPIILGILILSAVITPTPDILSQLIVGIPLYSLFEVSLL